MGDDYFHAWKEQLLRDESAMGRNVALRRHFNQALQGGQARHPIVQLKRVVASAKKKEKNGKPRLRSTARKRPCISGFATPRTPTTITPSTTTYNAETGTFPGTSKT